MCVSGKFIHSFISFLVFSDQFLSLAVAMFSLNKQPSCCTNFKARHMFATSYRTLTSKLSSGSLTTLNGTSNKSLTGWLYVLTKGEHERKRTEGKEVDFYDFFATFREFSQ